MIPRARALLLPSLIVLGLTGCPTEEEVEYHGYACVEVRPGLMFASDVSALFAGTTEIRVQVSYGQCLQDFYLSTHPNYAQDGVDGEPVFEEWKEKLCSEEIAGPFECEVRDVIQILNTNNYSLQVNLGGINPAGIEGRKIPIGPLPLNTLTENGCSPQVSLAAGSAVSGYDSNGAQIWTLETFNVDKANAGLDGRGCMTVNVKRN